MTINSDVTQRMRAAVALQQGGKPHEALEAYRALMEKAPDFPDAFHFGALAAHELGNDEQARSWLLTAERLAPDNANFQLNGARFFMETGAFKEAERRAARARELMPDQPNALVQHAIALIALDRGDELIEEVKALASRHPKEATLAVLLGRCQLQGGFRTQARNTLERICEQNDNTMAQLEFGDLLRDEGKTEAAREYYKRAILMGTATEQAIARCGLAATAAQLGERTLARHQAEQALSLDSSFYPAWRYLAGGSPDEELTRIKPRLEQARAAATPPDDLVLDFELGRLLERQHNYTDAWETYRQANAKRLHGSHNDDAGIKPFFDEVRRWLDTSFLNRHAALGSDSEQPIFIVGMPRSGTTLVERALGGHAAVHEGGELKSLSDALKRRAGPQHRHDLPRWLGTCSTEELQVVKSEWQQEMEDQARGKLRLTDKLPSNFTWLGLVHACFPNSTIVHVQRDPRDVFVSTWATLFESNRTYYYDMDSFRTYYQCYLSIMQHWKQICHHERFIEVDYETLTEDFDDVITRILNASGLDWDPACRQFAKRGGSVSTASLFQVRRPLNRDSVGRWQHFREQLGPLADLQAWHIGART